MGRRDLHTALGDPMGGRPGRRYLVNSTMIDDYNAARHADELAREANDLGYATERAMHKADGARQPVTLGQWMRHAQPAAPSPDEEKAAAIAECLSAMEEADAMASVAAGYAAVRDGEVVALSKLGMSYADIAAVTGRSRARVGIYVKNHRARTARR